MAGEGSGQGEHFFVTRESQTSLNRAEASYAGLRDLTDLEKISELDIVGPRGTLRGIKNRVRAGLATFENRGTLVKVSELLKVFRDGMRYKILHVGERGRGWFTSYCN